MIKERTCACCGRPIDRNFVELAVTVRRRRNSKMRKLDLHPECLDRVWELASEKKEADE